jgi:hypothetical protein
MIVELVTRAQGTSNILGRGSGIKKLLVPAMAGARRLNGDPCCISGDY